MKKPVILSLDDEPHVASAIHRDLRNQYGKTYRLIKTGSGKEALEVLKQLSEKNYPVALIMADQRMPEMSGTEFLGASREYYPKARKVLLTAYADTEAAITSINSIELDYYLLKPWDPPELNLYPVLNGLLEDWWTTAVIPYDGIRVAGTLWSASCHDVKDFLARNRIPYQWLDIEKDEKAKKLVEDVVIGEKVLPIVFFPDGEVISNPEPRLLAEKVGLQTEASAPHYDVIIIGGGPAGLAAGVYGASEGLKTLLIEKEATGGQAGTSSLIENYLGFPKGVSGSELAKRATDQAIRLGCEILTTAEAVSITVQDAYKVIALRDGSEISCKALVIATGVAFNKLNLPGVSKFSGAGIYYGAALTEAINYKGKDVIIVGGANSAGQGAMFFASYARSVTLTVRGSALENKMSAYLIDQIVVQDNITVLLDTEVQEFIGEDRLEGVLIHNNVSQTSSNIPASAAFIFIGAQARTQIISDVVACDDYGFILTDKDLLSSDEKASIWKHKRDPYFLETSVPGIFAAGDVRQSSVKRVASAVGQGAIAIALVHQYLKEV
ncbi:MAG: FAD-dependent oxidoreductase [Candidatus Marinimicrobia bacterium]|nr:FAD-dependent oxidoreductase [FCB group bacterium]MBL7028234.1 FAD-dependent oxidoreductase [Candidatus Neomarinimicrobiota bacterium]